MHCLRKKISTCPITRSKINYFNSNIKKHYEVYLVIKIDRLFPPLTIVFRIQ